MKAAKWIIPGVVIVALIFGGVYQNSRIERLESEVRLMVKHETVTKADVDAKIAAALYTEGARVYHTVAQAIPTGTETTLAFNGERYDTDAIHDNTTNNSRLTCKTAGKYIISASLGFNVFANENFLEIRIVKNGYQKLAVTFEKMSGTETPERTLTTIWDLAVDEYIEVIVIHDYGSDRNVGYSPYFSPEFMMQRIG